MFNEGPWRVSSVQVVISWPHQVAADGAQGKWLLYPEGVPTVDGEAGNIAFTTFLNYVRTQFLHGAST